MKGKAVWFALVLTVVFIAGSAYARRGAREPVLVAPEEEVVSPLDGYAGQTI